MILPCSSVQLAVVNIYMPSCMNTSWYQFICIILDHCDSRFLSYNMNWAYLGAIGDRINNPIVQIFQNILPHCFLHYRIQSSLWVPSWLGILNKIDPMYNGRVYSFDIRHCPPYPLLCSLNTSTKTSS